jgi:hypothetical protein
MRLDLQLKHARGCMLDARVKDRGITRVSLTTHQYLF